MSVKITNLEYQRAPIIAECVRIGALGQLIMANTVNDPKMPPAPQGAFEEPRINSVERIAIDCIAEGMTDNEIARRLKISSGAVVETLKSLRSGISASNRAQTVRRAAEWRGIDLPAVPVLSRTELAERISPRQLVILGLISHGLTQEQTATVLSLDKPLVTSQLRRCNERLVQGERGHVGLTLAHAFALRALMPDDYLTTDYVMEGMQRLMHPRRKLTPPPGCPDFQPFPWPLVYIGR